MAIHSTVKKVPQQFIYLASNNVLGLKQIIILAIVTIYCFTLPLMQEQFSIMQFVDMNKLKYFH